MKRLTLFALSSAFILFISYAFAEEQIASLRKGIPLDEVNKKPAPIAQVEELSTQMRAYPMQPPVIPHQINDYQLDLNVNKCLSCHSRTRVEESQAPMISVTHFMDRDANFLADVSPRRYFCLQCHVTQDKVNPIVKNEFIDVNEIIRSSKKEQ